MSNDNLIHEERMDLFSVPKGYYLVHSISGGDRFELANNR